MYLTLKIICIYLSVPNNDKVLRNRTELVVQFT